MRHTSTEFKIEETQKVDTTSYFIRSCRRNITWNVCFFFILEGLLSINSVSI